MTPAQVAIAYATRRYEVLALAPGGKLPLTAHFPHAVKSATTDRSILGRAFREVPNANVGLAIPSDLVVLDVDVRNGGVDTLRELVRTHGKLPTSTPRQKTASGGAHILFYRPKDVALRTKLGQGIELLGRGRYVVVAPSAIVVCRACGAVERSSCTQHEPRRYAYEWIVRLSRAVPSEMPAWLVDLARAPLAAPVAPSARVPVAASARLRSYLATLDPAISGQGGHAATFRAACVIVGNCADPSEQYALIAEYNIRCKPPWSRLELEHKLADARKKNPAPLPDRPLDVRRSA